MAVCTATKFADAFYQIIKDTRFPLCRPYGTSGDDKRHDFGTAFWDGTKYKSNSAETRANLQNNGFNMRNTMLKTNFNAGTDEISYREWNQLLTKIRQEFALRDEGQNKYIPTTAKVGFDEHGNSVSGSDNHQFFGPHDKILKQDYRNIFSDLISLLTYEVESLDAVNNGRIPSDKVSYFSYDNGNALAADDYKTSDKSPVPQNEGTHLGNNWWTGGLMTQHMYRYAVNYNNLYIDETLAKKGPEGALVPVSLPSDILTNKDYGYTARGTRTITATTGDISTNKTVVSVAKPYGNKDYIDTVTEADVASGLFTKDQLGWAKKDPNHKGYYKTSKEYDAMIAQKDLFLNQKIKVTCKRTVVTGKDEYGDPIYQEEEAQLPMQMVWALAADVPPTGGGWTINIKAKDVNQYYMGLVNRLASTCVCNCNYCSCFGHEASCVCYVVKVSGYCYSYQYNVEGGNFNNCIGIKELEEAAKKAGK